MRESQTRTFARLVWAEWRHGVTGPTSAILFVLALVLGTAGVLGVPLPAERFTLPLSWAVAVGAVLQSAFKVWQGEHSARLAAEEKLGRRLSLSYDNLSAVAVDTNFDAPGRARHVFLVTVKNQCETALENCLLQVIVTSVKGYEHAYQLCEPFPLLLDQQKEIPFVEHDLGGG